MGRNFIKNYDLGFVRMKPYNYNDKEYCIQNHVSYMLNRTQSMFIYDGLPDTIPQRILELYLQTNGNVCFYKYNDNLYVFTGGLGGVPDVYYMPTKYIIANPGLNISKTLDIGTECVVMRNDSLWLGLLPLFNRYATALVENELSMKIAMINSRIPSLISADDDVTLKSAQKYLDDIESGKMGVIGSSEIFDGIQTQAYGTTGNTNLLTNLIENEQYLKASWFNELGLNANYNMKRESLNTTESQLNDDMLLPLIDDMLNSRKIALEEVNMMFGTDITISLSSSWEDNAEEIALAHEQMTDDIDDSDPETENSPETETEEIAGEKTEVDESDERSETDERDKDK